MRVTHEEIQIPASRRVGRPRRHQALLRTPIRWLPRCRPRPGQARRAPPRARPWPRARDGGSPTWCAPAGPRDRPFEERQSEASISLVLSGTFVYRGEHGASLLSAGSLHAGKSGARIRVLARARRGRPLRCPFQFDAQLFDRLAHDAGASCAAFGRQSLPPLRALAQLTARARTAMASPDAFEEIAVELAGAVRRHRRPARREPSASSRH